MMPAMCVPCPNSSFVPDAPVAKFTAAATLPVRAACEAMPESTTATPMPFPEIDGEPSTPSSNPLVAARA